MAASRTRKPLVRRFSFLASLVMVAGLVGSATSCAQIIGVNKDYKQGSFAPKTWYCLPSQYDEISNGVSPENAFCDCVCGAYDPDCDNKSVGGISDHEKAEYGDDGIEDGSTGCKVCNFVETSKGDDGECAAK